MSKKAEHKNKIKIIKLIKLSFVDWFGSFNAYTKIVLAVALPVALITILQSDGSLGDFGLTMAFAWSFTIIAIVIYASQSKQLKDEKISTIYSLASARFLQYLGVTLVMIFFAVPGIFGLLGILSALTQQGGYTIIILILGVLGIGISAHLLVRFCLSQVIAISSSKSVYQSLQSSSKVTRGNRLKIFLAFLIMLTAIFLIANGVQLLLSFNRSINENIYVNNIVYVLEASVFLPIIYIFQTRLKEILNG